MPSEPNNPSELIEANGPTDVLLSLEHVTLDYGDPQRDGTRALADISLELHAGERLCVLGANGSGKSTLASVLCGLLAPDEGSVRLLGEDACVDGVVDLEAYRRARRGLGLVFQNPDDQVVTSVVRDDVAFGPENLGVPPEQIERRILREIHRVALDDYADADPRRLSGGQQQRVAVAGALAMESRAIIFDEPGALLDVRGRRALLHVMDRLSADGVGIVHITHYMEEALGADRVLVLGHGHKVYLGTPEEVFAPENNLSKLGLEQPFAGRLSERLAARDIPVSWTCDDVALMAQLTELGGRGRKKGASDAGSTMPGTDRARGAAGPDAGPAANPTASPISTTTSAPASATDQPALAARHVSFSYTGERGRRALSDVSVAVPKGQTTALVGQTGSGKSTLLRLLCALELPDAGEVLIDGMDTRGPKPEHGFGVLGGFGAKRRRRAWQARLRSSVGFVMQRPERQLFANTVEEDIAFGPTNLGLAPDEVHQRVERALELSGLAARRHSSPFELSGGKQRMCAIAGILAMQPNTIVLDEPMAGLDPHSRSELRALLGDLAAHGVTIVQVTHSMDDAALVDQVVVLDQSQVLASGSPHEVFVCNPGPKLAAHGLGLPRALSYASGLEEAGFAAPGALGNPLSLDELVEALVAVLSPELAADSIGTADSMDAPAHAPAGEVPHGV